MKKFLERLIPRRKAAPVEEESELVQRYRRLTFDNIHETGVRLRRISVGFRNIDTYVKKLSWISNFLEIQGYCIRIDGYYRTEIYLEDFLISSENNYLDEKEYLERFRTKAIEIIKVGERLASLDTLDARQRVTFQNIQPILEDLRELVNHL